MGFEVKKSKTQEIQTRYGFKSKSAFYLAFKALHGIRPVDWIKENL
jgi:AraC-like DNA-binding protein